MRVRIIDDINVQDVRTGEYILWPNSVRRDITHEFSVERNARIGRKRWTVTKDGSYVQERRSA